MAEPKKQKSISRTRKAFAKKNLKTYAVGKCPGCGKTVASHRRCVNCVG